MPDEKDEPTTDTDEYTDERDRWSLDRRNYLVGLGAALAGASALPTAAADISSGGPPDNNSWSVRVADDFEGGQLDTSIWSVGWGWGTQTTQGSMYTDERAISIRDSVLELSILNEPDTYPVGAINTKNKETIGPGTYVEARTRSANLPGTTSNFWSKPNSEDWPPEIDFKETPTTSTGRPTVSPTAHTLTITRGPTTAGTTNPRTGRPTAAGGSKTRSPTTSTARSTRVSPTPTSWSR